MPALNKYLPGSPTLIEPFTKSVAVVPDDANDLVEVTRGLSVNTDGTVRATWMGMADGTYEDIYCLRGVRYPDRIKRVWATGTDATGIKGFY